jgi:hypothetical protein
MRRIGGTLDYSKLAMQHRPTDPERLAAEVRRLAEQGLTATDISSALRVDLAAVRTMLAATGDEAAAIHREHADRGRT